jgi:UDP:flavonoid glycosyltransferase YjiC (YdhE family)
VLWSPEVPPPPWWDSLPTDRPVVYVTLGSSGRSDLLPLVLKALADSPVTVIAATAGRVTVADVPANAFVADYLPGEAAAKRADVVVCNGGSPTTQQALAAGKPVIGLASNLDQFRNMQAIERQGAGVLLRSGRIIGQELRSAVETIRTTPSYQTAAEYFATVFAELKTHGLYQDESATPGDTQLPGRSTFESVILAEYGTSLPPSLVS